MKSIMVFLLWCGVIFTFSHQDAQTSSTTSADFTKGVIAVFDTVTDNDTTPETVDKIIKSGMGWIRKSGHFIEYFILGILILNVLKNYMKGSLSLLIASLLFCFFYACSDEFHQLFVIGRSCEIKDVLIDTMGSLTGIVPSLAILTKFDKLRSS